MRSSSPFTLMLTLILPLVLMAEPERQVVEPRMKVGGFTDRVQVSNECSRTTGQEAASNVDATLCLGASKEQSILDSVKGQVVEILQKQGYNGIVKNFELKLVDYATQVVAGINHDMRVQLMPHRDVVRIRVFEPLYSHENQNYEVSQLEFVGKVNDDGKYEETERAIPTAVTINKYPLIVEKKYGIPFLINKEGKGHHIEGEVFSVTPECLKALDQLEGYPNWYDRHLISVKCSDGPQVQKVLVYMRNLVKSPMDWEKEEEGDLYQSYTLQLHKQFYVAGLAERA
ncbi:hypothetical protein FOL47_000650 [Perkinsus chesapeaki]|uniref:Gamma-glutamylcyclotransferase family protein n=1 Tax=Perkinsus chesapeaki TaxID=330153 RepID=A0A7J6ML70_PERCH|nr:hypothetical protein FOL47_000650 [Perkinsus chesapeaki]